ncbi:MAG: hypothetical protein IPM93_14165 [Candidatus Obscuribacter sp.]|nr:hypothetical protein [Candidatus Obscuribacter sp.]
MADTPQESGKKAGTSGVNFEDVLGLTPEGPRGSIGDPLKQINRGQAQPQDTSGAKTADKVQPQTASDQSLAPTVGADRPQLKFTGRTLELSYNDKDFEKKLAYAGKVHGKDFDTLKVTDMPPGTKITPWVNSRGFFFYFNDGTQTPKEFHYLPSNLTRLETKEMTDLNKLRADVMVAYNNDMSKTVTDAGSGFGGFMDFSQRTDPRRDGAASAFQYFQRMSGLSTNALNSLESNLREGVKTSDSPYLKIWLADVYVGQAMKSVVDQALTGRPVDLKDPAIMRKLDDAISLNKAARMTSDENLGQNGMKRQGNGYLPMMPFNPYWDARNRNGYYGFWGGSGDQAAYREAALTTIKAMIESNALPKMQLPPAQPPRY